MQMNAFDKVKRIKMIKQEEDAATCAKDILRQDLSETEGKYEET